MIIGENDDQPMDLYEKYESQWEGLSHILWKIKKCSKPPTSIYIYIYIGDFPACHV